MTSGLTYTICNQGCQPGRWVSLTNGRHVLASVALASDEQWASLQVWLLVKESQQAPIQILGHLCVKCRFTKFKKVVCMSLCCVCAMWIMSLLQPSPASRLLVCRACLRSEFVMVMAQATHLIACASSTRSNYLPERNQNLQGGTCL